MEATECPFHAAAPGNPKTNAADKEGKANLLQQKTQPTKTSSNQTINAPRWFDSPIVRLIGWVFEVPQVAAKEERSVLWYASDGLSGEMGCLGKSDD